MIKLTQKQLEQIDAARKDALEKIDIFKSGMEFAYLSNLKLEYKRMEWIDLLKRKISQNPFAIQQKSSDIFVLNIHTEAELEESISRYLVELEREVVKNCNGHYGMSVILEAYGNSIKNILNV